MSQNAVDNNITDLFKKDLMDSWNKNLLIERHHLWFTEMPSTGDIPRKHHFLLVPCIYCFLGIHCWALLEAHAGVDGLLVWPAWLPSAINPVWVNGNWRNNLDWQQGLTCMVFCWSIYNSDKPRLKLKNEGNTITLPPVLLIVVSFLCFLMWIPEN